MKKDGRRWRIAGRVKLVGVIETVSFSSSQAVTDDDEKEEEDAHD